MAYRFNGSSDDLQFALGPFASSYVFNAFTSAVLLKRNTLATNQHMLAFATTVASSRWRDYLISSDVHQLGLSGSSNANSGTQLANSTSPWYLLAVTRAAGSGVTPRFHLWNGSSWSHVAGSAAQNSVTIDPTDTFFLGGAAAIGNFLSADVVCAGIKKADSADVTIETLSPTTFAAWLGFGFDWLVSLDAAGGRVNLANPGSGNEIGRSGTSLVSDPPGWSWGATVSRFSRLKIAAPLTAVDQSGGVVQLGASDASSSAKGVVQLAGDLAGTATAPQIAAGVIVDGDVAAAAALEGSKFAWHIGTTPPASPSDGMLWIYQGSGFYWMFVYDSSEPTYKWKFVGGPPMSAEVFTSESPTSGAVWVDLPTDGPSLTFPRAGDYRLEWWCAANSTDTAACAFSAGAAAAGGTPGWFPQVTFWQNTIQGTANLYGNRAVLNIGAGTLWKLRYMVNPAGTLSTRKFSQRRLEMLPYRVS